MSDLAILHYPDPRLRRKAEAVDPLDDSLRPLAFELVRVLRTAPAYGITAVHLGVLRRVAMLELPDDAEPSLYLNPEIVWASAETSRHEEGSVSLPGVTETVERPARVRVRFQDMDGETREEEAEGFRAACLQHEIDQLDGVFWIERLSRLKRERLLKRFQKASRALPR